MPSSKSIPTYQLSSLANREEQLSGVFFFGGDAGPSVLRTDIPYRSNYYKIGLCLHGKAELKADLDPYSITPGCLIVATPHIIKQWCFVSEDYASIDLFFTPDFITAHNSLNLDKFRFLERGANPVFQISAAQAKNIGTSLRFIRQKYGIEQDCKDDVLRSLISSLLYEIASVYNRYHTALASRQTRSQFLVSEFKKLVHTHFETERSLKFYAGKLFVTPKYLTEVMKAVTGKTAGEWITQSVILEAKILLQRQSLNIAQISDALHFSDQSAFGKFFKNQVGLSPVAYKQAL